MKKRIKINLFLFIILILFLISCVSKPVKEKIIKKNNVIKTNKIMKKEIKSSVDIDKFTGIIDDFEDGLKYWVWSSRNNTSFKRITENGKNHIGEFSFKAIYSPEEFHSQINIVLYKRKMDFSSFKGIRFFAKGTGKVLFKIKILEKEDYYKEKNVNEIWYKIFKVDNTWKEYVLLFKEMQVEEYYEQDYISDNLQVFTNIVGICFTAQNMSTTEAIDGKLYIDDIELF